MSGVVMGHFKKKLMIHKFPKNIQAWECRKDI